MDTPSVGRIVMFKSHGSPVLPDGTQKYPSVLRAAIITEIDTEQDSSYGLKVSLAVINPEGFFFKQGVEWGDKPGQWSWPVKAPTQAEILASTEND